MKRLATAIAITAVLAAAATHQYLHASTDPHRSDLQSKLLSTVTNRDGICCLTGQAE